MSPSRTSQPRQVERRTDFFDADFDFDFDFEREALLPVDFPADFVRFVVVLAAFLRVGGVRREGLLGLREGTGAPGREGWARPDLRYHLRDAEVHSEPVPCDAEPYFSALSLASSTPRGP